jgi:hypothetical protein
LIGSRDPLLLKADVHYNATYNLDPTQWFKHHSY